ncbi:hypothetical protein [Staphylococcus lutrae]|uniref:SPIN family peroxidase inhibitor n=1 Tax=Staphylococcus lutrae TaxID=155085 RepID=A0AAC9WMT4_9STAP|nr:hypothetical protein [Staphylococcus lutrae]ARJ51557.1 hypothetical protein B5P37_09655 [Staphylococcus lutrae]PNZ39205.1 hypothetical protein CD134_02000 [Staphylococcus lutrae]
MKNLFRVSALSISLGLVGLVGLVGHEVNAAEDTAATQNVKSKEFDEHQYDRNKLFHSQYDVLRQYQKH